MVESSEKRVTTLQKSINRRQVLGGGWGWRPLPNPFPCLTPPQTMFHTLIHVAQIFILLNQQNRCLHKKSFQKMHRRGKTCFLKTFKINSNQKSQIVDQKSKTLNLEFWQNPKKSFQKMHPRGKTCFLHHTKSNPKTLSALRNQKWYTKIWNMKYPRQPQNKPPNMQNAQQDDDTRRPQPHTRWRFNEADHLGSRPTLNYQIEQLMNAFEPLTSQNAQQNHDLRPWTMCSKAVGMTDYRWRNQHAALSRTAVWR